MPDISKLLNHFFVFRANYKKIARELLKLRIVKVFMVVDFSINAAVWLVAWYIFSNIEQENIALHYSVDFGIDLYGPTGKVFIVPTLGLLFILANLALILVVARYNRMDAKFAGTVMLITACLTNIFLLAATASIYLINFR